MKKSSEFSVKARVRSFGYAFAGMAAVIRGEHNAWIHALATMLVIVFGAWLQVSRIEWAILVIAISSVWLGESINTAVEATIDLIGEEHELAKIAKDTAAAGVLFAAIGAAIAGFLILGPPLWVKLFS
jgi:diacylglycerol kinase (ATP)